MSPLPGDVDVLYEAQSVQPRLLPDVFRYETASNKEQRQFTYGGDYRAVFDEGNVGLIAYFQSDRGGIPKGIITISLSSLPSHQ